jgi:hypothetical protein
MILLAAAPGEILPKFPSPLHVFSNLFCQLHVDIDDIKVILYIYYIYISFFLTKYNLKYVIVLYI